MDKRLVIITGLHCSEGRSACRLLVQWLLRERQSRSSQDFADDVLPHARSRALLSHCPGRRAVIAQLGCAALNRAWRMTKVPILGLRSPPVF